ncbi:MAG: hypothetical protein IPG79_00535 [Saprospiraceae bacterium]|nr:hypothetical protein [Saprospiraceae bacterium]MBK9042397.1 hypothetical protein [Saprospiraceae bacterium]
MQKRLYTFFILVLVVCKTSITANTQDVGLLGLGKTMQQTFINPAANLEKTWNLSLGNLRFEILTDGPTFNQLTKKNIDGNRYIRPDGWQNSVNDLNLLSANVDIHTIDFGCKAGKWFFMAGHAFRNGGSLTYTSDVLKLVANGNGPYINQTLSIGPVLDFLTYNEIYLGAQKKISRFTIGLKAKLLFGVSNFRTDEPTINYRTKSDFYQWEFDVDYSIRSSSALILNDITDITLNPSGFNFDHLFYNNTGLAFDIGMNMELSKKINIFWSALDLGFITWTFLPRNYISKGNFTFDGIDPITYINDTTGFNFTDSLSQLIPFTTIDEKYTTSLNNRFFLGATYEMNEKWSFNGLLRFHRSFVKSNAQLSLAATRRWKWVETGLSYSVTNGNLFNIGTLVNIKINPVSFYLATDNFLGAFDIFDQKLANFRGGLNVSF